MYIYIFFFQKVSVRMHTQRKTKTVQCGVTTTKHLEGCSAALMPTPRAAVQTITTSALALRTMHTSCSPTTRRSQAAKAKTAGYAPRKKLAKSAADAATKDATVITRWHGHRT